MAIYDPAVPGEVFAQLFDSNGNGDETATARLVKMVRSYAERGDGGFAWGQRFQHAFERRAKLRG